MMSVGHVLDHVPNHVLDHVLDHVSDHMIIGLVTMALQRIKEDDNWKTAFRTRYGHFEYQVMPFELSNAPVSFQDYINKILAKKLNVFVIVYLDDILIYIKDAGWAHIDVVRWMLNKLRKHGLFANFKKCRFHKDEVRFLGYIVSGKRVRMEDKQIEEVKN